MFRKMTLALLAGASCLVAGIHQAAAIDAALPEPNVIYANQPAQPAPVRTAYAERSNMGGGFIEFLFGDQQQAQGRGYPQQPVYQQQPSYEPRRALLPQQGDMYQGNLQQADPQQEAYRSDAASVRSEIRKADGRLQRQGKRRHHRRSIRRTSFSIWCEGNGKALRYGIGVGKPGFTWSGVKTISAKKEWPDWTPPAEMLVRRPDLPRHMEGGPQNPLGARAMYLGSSLYRIHGSNEPWTIGTNVSSGCIRMRNQDVIDLYGRVNVGAKVVVI